jgi:hypothetical protein
MKKTILTTIATMTLVAWAFQVTADPPETPKPGLKPVIGGTWMEIFSGGGEGQTGNIIRAAKEDVFAFEAVLQGPVESLTDPYWEWKTTYIQGVLTLWNTQKAPWYNKKAPVGPYTYTGITVVNLTHKPTSDADMFEFSLMGTLFGDRVILYGGFVGIPVAGSGVVNGQTYPAMSGPLTTAAANAFPMNAVKK